MSVYEPIGQGSNFFIDAVLAARMFRKVPIVGANYRINPPLMRVSHLIYKYWYPIYGSTPPPT